MKKKTIIKALLLLTISLASASMSVCKAVEDIGRGVVAVNVDDSDVYVGWRMFATDPADIAFNLYRSTGGAQAVKLNTSPITQSTNYVDPSADLNQTNAYYVCPVLNGQEQPASNPYTLPANPPVRQYIPVPLQRPAGGITPDGVNYSYSANDASVGDLDADGEYEIVLKWDPSNSKDNSEYGYTGNVILDAYEIDGTRLWRIDLGKNIRAGAHYTQFMVYDLDGDGKAEVACKTAPGTTDGLGNDVILPGDDPDADYRNSNGYILDGPEYLTIFDGETGAELATTNYIPPRGVVSDWGDDYGNRVDRFLACIAYLDGQQPSLVMCRGYYTRTVLAAWDWRNGQLTQRWVFDTGFSGGPWADWKGQGNHNLSVADVDGDGKDEIIYGACAIDDDGTGLWTTGLGHGDAMHLSDIDPVRPGLEVWGIHENATVGSALLDAQTGEIIWGTGAGDVGRGVSADLTANYLGMECWGGTSGLRSCDNQSAGSTPSSSNHVCWWDGDLLRELLNDISITKYGSGTLLTASGCASNNGTKANPCLQADLFGDWREEVVWRTSDNTQLRIYTTVIPTDIRIYTLMHDHVYRLGIAWQNVAYNQPPHTGFYLGDGMDPIYPDTSPPEPNVMSWQTPPYASGSSSISMTATTAVDDTQPVMYYFECVTNGDANSSWRADPNYTATGLDSSTSYSFRVKARDSSPAQNETEWSGIESATTQPPGSDVEITGDWAEGLSHPEESGNRRALLFFVYAESSSSAVDVASVTYGGRPMTEVVDMVYTSSYSAYTAAFILDDAGIAAATDGEFVVNWNTAPSGTPAYSSVFLVNVDQDAPLGQTGTGGSQSTTAETQALSTEIGDMAFVAATCGNEGSYSTINGFTKAIEVAPSSADGVAGYLLGSGGSVTPGVSHTDVNRQSVIGFVIRAAEMTIDEPPAEPTSLAATPGNKLVELDWDDNNEPDLQGYNVYRSQQQGDNYHQINVAVVPDSNYTDTTCTNGTPYYYVVTAVDANDNESGYSNEASATPDYQSCRDVIDDGFGLISDINGDCYVDFKDVGVIAYYWLRTDCGTVDDCEGADISPADGDVDLFDFSDFAVDWTRCNHPQDANCPPSW